MDKQDESLTYDDVRSENIKRNHRFLAEIGLPVLERPQKKKREYSRAPSETLPMRRSSRLADIPAPSYRVNICGCQLFHNVSSVRRRQMSKYQVALHTRR